MERIYKGLIVTTFLYLTPVITLAENLHMAGGYVTADNTDQAIKSAADFAVQEINQGVLVKIVTAQTQVVAGINYKLQLQILKPDGTQQVFNVVVFKPLPVTGLPLQLMSAEHLP